jgi:GNAT superfamily N-acetyltransferase
MSTAVRPLEPTGVDALAVTLAKAFADDPVFEFLVPGIEPAARVPLITPFFRIDIRQRMRHPGVFTTDGHEGGALWAPPNTWRVGVRDGMVQGWPLIRASRGRSLLRILGMFEIEKAHPKEPHWYLAVLGTDPAHQGKGIGASLLGPMLERCDREGIPAYLESSKLGNVPYYERFGFKVTGEVNVPRGGPTLPLMWRDPQ